MEVKNNPAGRLYDLLANFIKVNDSATARDAWASVFEADSKDTESLLRLQAEMLLLVGQAKEAITDVNDIDHGIYLQPFKSIEKMFLNCSLGLPSHKWKQLITENVLYGLQFCSDLLGNRSEFKTVNSEDLEDISSAIDELIESVISSGIEDDLKELIFNSLDSIRRAIGSFRVKGIGGLQEAVELSTGRVFIHKESVKESSKAEPEVWNKFFAVVDRLNGVVTLAHNLQKLAGNAAPLLLSIIS